MSYKPRYSSHHGVVECIKTHSSNRKVRRILSEIYPVLAKKETNIRIHLEALLRDSLITEGEFQTIVTKMNLGKLCLGLEELITDGYVTILFYDQQENKIYHGAGPSFQVEFFDFFHDINESNLFSENCGSCGAAVHRKTVVVADIITSPLWVPFREYMAKWGFRTCWSIPFFRDGDVIGSFAIYHRSARKVSKQEVELVKRQVGFYQESIFYIFDQLLVEKEA